MDEEDVRFAGGVTATAALLAAEHFFPWWNKLPRLVAYSLGTAAILAGQGIYAGFDRKWRRLAIIAMAGGLVVMASWLYDELAKGWAKRAGGSDGLPAPPKR